MRFTAVAVFYTQSWYEFDAAAAVVLRMMESGLVHHRQRIIIVFLRRRTACSKNRCEEPIRVTLLIC